MFVFVSGGVEMGAVNGNVESNWFYNNFIIKHTNCYWPNVENIICSILECDRASKLNIHAFPINKK